MVCAGLSDAYLDVFEYEIRRLVSTCNPVIIKVDRIGNVLIEAIMRPEVSIGTHSFVVEIPGHYKTTTSPHGE